jgi:hypothetical protein
MFLDMKMEQVISIQLELQTVYKVKERHHMLSMITI